MAFKTEDLEELITSLSAGDRALVQELHREALSLGCTPKIPAPGKTPKDRKCEYFLDKKTQLFVLQIRDTTWSIRAKLYNIAQYPETLAACNQHTKETLLRNAKNCGSHGGGCKGPVEFALEGEKHLKCRHSLLFDHITGEDLESLKTLLRRETGLTGQW